MDVAAARADVLLLLLPDEIAPDIYRRMIEPHLGRGKTLVFASGTTSPTSSSCRRATSTSCSSRRG